MTDSINFFLLTIIQSAQHSFSLHLYRVAVYWYTLLQYNPSLLPVNQFRKKAEVLLYTCDKYRADDGTLNTVEIIFQIKSYASEIITGRYIFKILTVDKDGQVTAGNL